MRSRTERLPPDGRVASRQGNRAGRRVTVVGSVSVSVRCLAGVCATVVPRIDRREISLRNSRLNLALADRRGILPTLSPSLGRAPAPGPANGPVPAAGNIFGSKRNELPTIRRHAPGISVRGDLEAESKGTPGAFHRSPGNRRPRQPTGARPLNPTRRGVLTATSAFPKRTTGHRGCGCGSGSNSALDACGIGIAPRSDSGPPRGMA